MAAKNAIKVSVAIMVSTQRRFGRDVFRTREPPSSTNGGILHRKAKAEEIMRQRKKEQAELRSKTLETEKSEKDEEAEKGEVEVESDVHNRRWCYLPSRRLS